MSDARNLLPAETYATSNEEGGRKWVYPRRAQGRFLKWRRIVAVGLITLYSALPHIRIAGKPAIFLDIPARRFTFFGQTFWPTDTLLLAFFGIGLVLTVVAVTAIFGRVWCGWACPQTVYMEFVYRPIERLLEGQGAAQEKFNASPSSSAKLLRKILKWTLFLIISFLLANTFLAYFVGTDKLWTWMVGSPSDHLFGFAVVLFITALMMFDFTWFREQMCTIACPYGRLQSVMTDNRTIQVGYDAKRGEPRGKIQRGELKKDEVKHGDCLDCKMCIQTCPTGIDIRNGLQLECIGCTQCIDACDTVMTRVGKPNGLIRYASAEALSGKKTTILKPRLFAYATIILVAIGGFLFNLSGHSEAEFSVLRAIDSPFQVLPDGRISNSLKFRVANHAAEQREYTITLIEPENGQLFVPSTLKVPGGTIGTVAALVMLPSDEVVGGRRQLTFVVNDKYNTELTQHFWFLGPNSR